jgi:DHA3 family tetracycline resistance protein-like MFS transporter
MSAYWVYLIYEGALSFLLTMIFTASDIYQVTKVGLTPLQLVLVGTTLETVILIFEIPTGVVADAYSRRLSVIIGVTLIGIGYLTEGTFPSFIPILIAQVIWGLGYTFTSGAVQAWISDEIGEGSAGRAFLRASRVGNLTALFGIAAGMWIGSLAINLPIQLGGIGMFLLALFLGWKMQEIGFEPASQTIHNKWEQMKEIGRGGLEAVRNRPVLWPFYQSVWF